jgi:DNA replicative helicase MCM subunit Mcm2 (Cdc46/Mcm family)
MNGAVVVLDPYPCIYSESVEYESNHDIILTELDKKAIQRFTQLKGDKIIDELVKMVAPPVIGFNHAKEGLLLAAASTGNDLDGMRKGMQRSRINVLLAGEPGNAKSVLLRASKKLVPGSRYETCQNSSGKSITAIIVKENGEREYLRLGPVPLARNAICALNELGNMPFTDQAHLLDAMEEGEFTISKYAINMTISSPTVIIASSNPTSSYWIHSEKVSADELPITKTILDRFDLTFAFRTAREEKAIREYAHKKSNQIDGVRRNPDYYQYLTRHILYSKQFDPYISSEAKFMLSEYYVRIARGFGSPRMLETLYRIARAISRLKLKKIVDTEDAKETMEFYNVILQQYDEVGIVSLNPRHTVFNECLNILEESHRPFAFDQLISTVCTRNEYAQAYVGTKHKLQNNKKLRAIADMVLNHSLVKCIKQKPLVLQWCKSNPKSGTHDTANGTNDLYDQYDPHPSFDNKNNFHDGSAITKDGKNNDASNNLESE